MTVQLSVTDIKQFIYCPRIVYYTVGLDLPRLRTAKMESGVEAHAQVQALERRRSLKAYGIEDEQASREFGVALFSERLGLSGRIDMAIVLAHEVCPVEFKDSEGRLGLHHKYQLTAYALLAEEHWGKPVRRVFVYWIPLKKAQAIRITPAMRRYTVRLINSIRGMLQADMRPPPTSRRARCRDCEFRRYCPDVM
jgi:CRISPR-associated exonuclease Cas4